MIQFFSHDVDFTLKSQLLYSSWIKDVIKNFHKAPGSKSVGSIAIVFCSDQYLLKLNKEYLNHNYFTDIITFDYSVNNLLSGDLFISIETVKFNAEQYKIPFEEELSRVIIHGILHLLGYQDSTPEQASIMKKHEDAALSNLKAKMNVN